jgi:DNA-binding NtrC family response regulator
MAEPVSNVVSSPPKIGVMRRAMGVFSKGALLSGRRILVIEEDAALAEDLTHALQAAGASALVTDSLRQAMALVADTPFCAAVVDYKIGERHSAELCWMLRGRSIPFVFYSNLDFLVRMWPNVVAVPKPSAGRTVVSAITRALR